MGSGRAGVLPLPGMTVRQGWHGFPEPGWATPCPAQGPGRHLRGRSGFEAQTRLQGEGVLWKFREPWGGGFLALTPFGGDRGRLGTTEVTQHSSEGLGAWSVRTVH